MYSSFSLSFPFYKNKKTHKILPHCHSHRQCFSGSPSPSVPYSHILNSRTSTPFNLEFHYLLDVVSDLH